LYKKRSYLSIRLIVLWVTAHERLREKVAMFPSTTQHDSIDQIASSPNNYDIQSALAGGYFARHETFCPRYGWLKKGFDATLTDPEVFERQDAIERLGVGINMVHSMKFWCVAFHIIASQQSSVKHHLSGPMKSTELGTYLLSDEGWDPFLEDPASLWLLHWQLFAPPTIATAWSLITNLSHLTSFTNSDLGKVLKEAKSKFPVLSRYSDGSVLKDISCFIRMYATSGKKISDEIECPFTHLGLIYSGVDRDTYYFNMGSKATLPDEIVLATCFEYAHQTQPNQRTISLNRLAYGFSAPGIAFKLTETDIGNRLENVTSRLNEISLVELYGNRQLQFHEDPKTLYWQFLEKYYRGSTPRSSLL